MTQRLCTLRVKAVFNGKQITKLIQPSIRPQHLGGTGKADGLALIGQNMLKMFFAENSLRRGVMNKEVIQKYQAQLLSAENIARCAPVILAEPIPPVIPMPEMNKYSMEERQRLLEAYVGALHLFDRFKLSEGIRKVTHDIVLSIKKFLPVEEVDSFTGLFAEVPCGNYRSGLIRLMQQCESKVSGGDLFLQQEQPPVSVGAPADHNDKQSTDSSLVIITFALTDTDLLSCGLPPIGPVHSEPCPNSAVASEEVARRVLELFKSHPDISNENKATIENIFKLQLESGKKILGFADDVVAPPQKEKRKINFMKKRKKK